MALIQGTCLSLILRAASPSETKKVVQAVTASGESLLTTEKYFASG
jgi:hypothetical protein